MAWLESLTHVLLSVSASTIVVGVVGYLGRHAVSQYLLKDLEKYRSKLAREVEEQRHEFTKELEKFKRELDVVLSERQARFSLMHQKRAEVITKLYGLIAPAEKALRRMAAPMRWGSASEDENNKQREAERAEAAKACEALQDFFDQNRIFLGEQSAALCDELLTHVRDGYHEFVFSQKPYSGTDRADHKQWMAAWKKITEHLPPAKKALEQDLRRALGSAE